MRYNSWRIKQIRLFLFIGFLISSILFLGFPLDAHAAKTINSYREEQILQTIRKHPEVVIEAIQLYRQQQEERKNQLLKEFSEQLKLNPKSVVVESPTTSSIATKIVLLEFSDFQCPYCAEVHKTLKEFLAKHDDKVTLVYKNLPLENLHPEALSAAKAAWAAGRQGKFWEYHDALFEQQKDLSESLYIKIAESLKLNIDQFNQDRELEAISHIREDIKLAQRLEISGTPFFIMNTEYFSGSASLSEMEDILARVLREQAKS